MKPLHKIKPEYKIVPTEEEKLAILAFRHTRMYNDVSIKLSPTKSSERSRISTKINRAFPRRRFRRWSNASLTYWTRLGREGNHSVNDFRMDMIET